MSGVFGDEDDDLRMMESSKSCMMAEKAFETMGIAEPMQHEAMKFGSKRKISNQLA